MDLWPYLVLHTLRSVSSHLDPLSSSICFQFSKVLSPFLAYFVHFYCSFNFFGGEGIGGFMDSFYYLFFFFFLKEDLFVSF